MKHKIPPEHFVDPNDGRPMRFDPATGTPDTAAGNVIPLKRLRSRGRYAPMAKLIRWMRSLSKGGDDK